MNKQETPAASASRHTPEPWELSHQLGDGFSIAHEIAPSCGRLIPVATAHNSCAWGGHLSDDVARANAERIAACVNACSGVAYPEIDIASMVKLAEMVNKWWESHQFEATTESRKFVRLAQTILERRVS